MVVKLHCEFFDIAGHLRFRAPGKSGTFSNIQNERIPKKALLRALRGIRSFAHAILFICKQYFKMCGISIPYICQETNGKFLFR